jgi:naringenin degradation protein FdeH
MAAEASGMKTLRRVVTGHDTANVAKVLLDTVVPSQDTGRSDAQVYAVWNTAETPADIAIGETIEDRGALPHKTPPPPNGTRLTIIDYPPGNNGNMHRTESVDYVIVMQGEIDMDMDDSTIKLKAGDVMIQRGTNHAWFNRGTETARIAFVLVDAQPLGIGHPRV